MTAGAASEGEEESSPTGDVRSHDSLFDQAPAPRHAVAPGSGIDRDKLNQALEAGQDAILACFRRETSDRPGVGALIKARLVVPREGPVVLRGLSWNVDGRHGTPGADECTRKTLLGLDLPRSRGDETRVYVTITLEPGQ